MRRIILALLICLLPLQSFAGEMMSAKMAGMGVAMSQMQMADSVQAPCHETSQPMQAADQDCCGSQGICQALCHVIAVLPSLVEHPKSFTPTHPLAAFVATFQSADLSAGFKPPLL